MIGLNNTGVGTAQNDAYALIATSPNIPEGPVGGQSPTPDIRAVGINTFPVPAGFCSASPSFLWVFVVNTHGTAGASGTRSATRCRSIPIQDGTDDYVVLNRDFSGLGTITDGRQLTWVLNLDTNVASAFFFAEHSMNTGNTALIICGEQVGMNAADFFTSVDMEVFAQDFYYGGPGDLVEGLTVAPLGERFVDLDGADDVPGNTNDADALQVYDFGLLPGQLAGARHAARHERRPRRR